MKSTRRHELQTNELADSLGRLIEKARPHGRAIAYAGVAVLAAVILLVVVSLMQSGKADVAASAFNVAMSAADAQAMRDFLRDYGATAKAPAARLLLADRIIDDVVAGNVPVAEGADPKAKARALLDEARDLYAQAAAGDAELKPLADVGLALVTVQEGDVAKGREALEAVVKAHPLSIAAAKAQAHVEALAGYKPVEFSTEPLEAPKPPADAPAPPAAPAAETPKTPEAEKPAAPAETPAAEKKPAG
jgi:hypothetical protein